MRKILLTGLLLGLIVAIGCRSAPRPPEQDFTVTATWQYDFTNLKPCSATIAVGCVSGFTWGYQVGSGTPVPLKTSPVTVCSGTTQPETCTDATSSQLPIGSLTPYIEAAGLDATGATVTSSETLASTPLAIAIVAPTNLTITAK